MKDWYIKQKSFNEIPPKVEYRLNPKGQELVGSIINQWLEPEGVGVDKEFRNVYVADTGNSRIVVSKP